MCISKRFANTGSTGNHGMQEVDVLKRRMIEDKFEQEKSEVFTLCGNGHEFTLLGEQIPLREALILGDFINENNLCPFCMKKKGMINFQYCVDNQEIIQEFKFTMNDKTYLTMYKPDDYRFLPAEILEDTE